MPFISDWQKFFTIYRLIPEIGRLVFRRSLPYFAVLNNPSYDESFEANPQDGISNPQLIKSLLQNDGTVVEFCKVHNIHKATFYNWRNKYELPIDKPAAFVPLQFDQPSLSSTLFAEIEMASNITIRIYQPVEASWFKSLIK